MYSLMPWSADFLHEFATHLAHLYLLRIWLRDNECSLFLTLVYAYWCSPTVGGYLQFLVDSRAVYAALEDAVAANPVLKTLQATGLERVAALDADIEWVAGHAGGSTLAVPEVGPSGVEYAALLTELAQSNIPRFMNHFYNHYFAHTAGGRMIGKKVRWLKSGIFPLPPRGVFFFVRKYFCFKPNFFTP